MNNVVVTVVSSGALVSQSHKLNNVGWYGDDTMMISCDGVTKCDVVVTVNNCR